MLGRKGPGRGEAILLVEQNLAFALRVADHVYLTSKGRIVHESAPDALRHDEANKARWLGVWAPSSSRAAPRDVARR